MTAPLKRNGKLVTTIKRGCESKVRYSDEFGARAAGMMYQEKNGEKLFLYKCGICNGWHITKKAPWNPADAWRAVDYDFSKSAQH